MKRVFAIAAVLIISLSIGSCNSKSSSGTNATTGIGPQGGTVSGPIGAEVIIPAGALSANVDIAVARDSSAAPDFPPADVNAAGAAYEITPHGTSFAVPVTIRIPFDSSQVPPNATPKMYKAELGGAFAEIPSTFNSNMLEASVTNLSWVIPGYAATRPWNIYALTANGIASYMINTTTGALSGPTSTALTGDEPFSIVTHPSGRFAYVTSGGTTTVNGVDPYSVSVYSLDELSGAISGPIAIASSTTSTNRAKPVTAVIHPTGKFLYVVNYGPSGSPDTDISVYTIDPVTGALTGPVSTGDSGGAPPTALAIDPTGAWAYVAYGWRTSTPVGNGYQGTVTVFSIDATTGAFASSPTDSVAIPDTPWSIVVDPSGQSVYVGSIGDSSNYDAVLVYDANAASGSLSYVQSVTVSAKPSSLAMDSEGRFLYVGKQDPYNNVNLEVYTIDGATGLLTLGDSALSGSGAMVGHIALVAEPQGKFVYVLDTNNELVSYQVSASGMLSSSGTVTGMIVPGGAGVGVPFSFASVGTSPVWVDGCTVGCGVVFTTRSCGGTSGRSCDASSGTNSGSSGVIVGGGNGMHYLNVSTGGWGGGITSSPTGINFGFDWVAGAPDKFTAEFANGTSVTLCETQPPTPAQGYYVQWTGGCSGTGTCTTVNMSSDKWCHLELIPVGI